MKKKRKPKIKYAGLLFAWIMAVVLTASFGVAFVKTASFASSLIVDQTEKEQREEASTTAAPEETTTAPEETTTAPEETTTAPEETTTAPEETTTVPEETTTAPEETATTPEETETQCRHDSTSIIEKKVPTCTQEGYSGDLICNSCKKILQEGEEIPKLKHGFGKEIPFNSYINKKDFKDYLLKILEKELKEKSKEEIAELAEKTYSELYKEIALKKTKQTHYFIHICSICDEIEFVPVAEKDPTLKKASHSYKETGRQDATLQAEGYVEYTCIDCDYVFYEILEKLACSHEKTHIENKKEATCEEATLAEPKKGLGYTGDLICDICGETLEYGHYTDRVAHEFDELEIIDKETDDAYHYFAKTCRKCGHKEYEYEKAGSGKKVQKKESHSYEEVEKVQATAAKDGYLLEKCSKCGHEYKEILPKFGTYVDRIRGEGGQDTVDFYLGYVWWNENAYLGSFSRSEMETLSNGMVYQTYSFNDLTSGVGYARVCGLDFETLVSVIGDSSGKFEYGDVQAFRFSATDNYKNGTTYYASDLFSGGRYCFPNASEYSNGDGTYSDYGAAVSGAYSVRALLSAYETRAKNIKAGMTLEEVMVKNWGVMTDSGAYRIMFGQSGLGDQTAGNSIASIKAITIIVDGYPSASIVDEKGKEINGEDMDISVDESNVVHFKVYGIMEEAAKEFEKNAVWTVQDESIVTIDKNGKITAHQEGTTVITVSATLYGGGESVAKTITQSFTITVGTGDGTGNGEGDGDGNGNGNGDGSGGGKGEEQTGSGTGTGDDDQSESGTEEQTGGEGEEQTGGEGERQTGGEGEEQTGGEGERQTGGESGDGNEKVTTGDFGEETETGDELKINPDNPDDSEQLKEETLSAKDLENLVAVTIKESETKKDESPKDKDKNTLQAIMISSSGGSANGGGGSTIKIELDLTDNTKLFVILLVAISLFVGACSMFIKYRREFDS